MSVEIKKVTSPKELKRFIRFNYEFYKENPYSVPDLYDDMLNTFSPKKNAAFEFCEADYFLAYRDGRIVGRVAAIINKRANERWDKRTVRFGWIDFIDDIEVSRALIDAVKAWGKERGMEEIEGPLGSPIWMAEGSSWKALTSSPPWPPSTTTPTIPSTWRNSALRKAPTGWK